MDIVNRLFLINELKHLGIGYQLVEWLKSYVTGRKHVVNVTGVTFRFTEVPSGVLEGGHLSLLLFSLFSAYILSESPTSFIVL